jgi:hypothetical protein
MVTVKIGLMEKMEYLVHLMMVRLFILDILIREGAGVEMALTTIVMENLINEFV